MSLASQLEKVYESLDGSEVMEAYSHRHGIDSAAILTVYNDKTAALLAQYLAPRIEGKVVVEVGGGIGLLAFHLADYARRVYCIEANPMWSWVFASVLLQQKPKNVSYLFGAADEFAGQIKGDVALFCTHSGVQGLKATAGLFAPIVIDVYGEMIQQSPDKFDQTASALREIW